jgi:hypothetical protein
LKKTQNNFLSKSRKLTDAQVISTVIISAKYFYGNQHNACLYMRDHWGFNMPNKSNFNRILHGLSNILSQLFYQLAEFFKQLNIESVYAIDSFPVPICKNIRISRAKLLKEEVFRGYNSSNERVFRMALKCI